MVEGSELMVWTRFNIAKNISRNQRNMAIIKEYETELERAKNLSYRLCSMCA